MEDILNKVLEAIKGLVEKIKALIAKLTASFGGEEEETVE